MKEIYRKIIFDHKFLVLLIFIIITAFFSNQIRHFRLDASSETLILQGNKNYEYYEEIKDRYGSDDYLIITYTPTEHELFSTKTIGHLSDIKKKLQNNKNIISITSILDVPLLKSPKTTLSELAAGNINSIERGNYTHFKDVKKELTTNPIYQDTLISSDGKTTAMLVTFDDSTDEDIAEVREILKEYKAEAQIYIGGVPMIVSDSIAYIDNDIETFGVLVIILITMLLHLSFRKLRWVIIPLANSSIATILMIGILGFINWPVTVVSSNFISLLLIISLSLSIHIIVQYEEFIEQKIYHAHEDLILNSFISKFKPCLYTALTTIVAFSSLVISDVKPIIDFGWMMVIGITVSFIITFFLMPILIQICSFGKKSQEVEFHKKITGFVYDLTSKNKSSLLIIFIFISIAGAYGMTKLSVKNRFIDYFKKETEIYKGMEVIDTRLGGTTPLEVIVDAPKTYEGQNYWYNSFILEDVGYIHNYLDSIPEAGKILSLNSTIEVLKEVNGGDVDSFLLKLLQEKISEELKDILLKPYLSEDGNQIRFSIRVYESIAGLDRDMLIKKIHKDLVEKFQLEEGDVKINGMLVLYNDLLQSLFKSQILTLGFVFLAITIMFIILFKSVKLSLIAIVPNLVAAIAVLGLMGWIGISLDIMTITIAAICVGIAVDDTIHYIHRFTDELDTSDNSWQAVKRSHNTIGRAIYLTTITITLGFSVLAFSNFVPTIYFGLLTGFSMVIALLADLILLPIMLGYFYKK